MINNRLRRSFWRVATALGVLWAAATLTFFAINLTSGDLALQIVGGAEAVPTPAVLARIRQQYQLDQPLPVQYYHYLSKLIHGDFGESYSLRIPVKQAIAQQIRPTLELAAVAGTSSIVLSIIIALLTARRPRWVTSTASGIELIISSIPGLVLGLGLLMLFSFQLHWLPASGQDNWKTIILPALVLAIPLTIQQSQVLRNALEEVLEQPFIVTARARGLSDVGVRLRHALRHALIPLSSLAGSIFGKLIGGAVIAEALFARQGVGRLLANATNTKDIPLVLAITLLTSLVYVVVHLMVDVLNVYIDPRLKEA